MRDLRPFERQMLLAEVYHYAWYNEEAYEDLLNFVRKYEKKLDKPVFFIPINKNDTETTNLEPLAYGQNIDTNPGSNEI
jgi:hypothetical protein